jgi:hypothetical protein
MNREMGRETPKQTHTGVITRSRRKSSQAGRDMEEAKVQVQRDTTNHKRAQIENDDFSLEELSELQVLFADFVEALNLKDNETISDRVKRGSRRKMVSNVPEEVPNRSLKRVKRDTRKSKGGKKAKEDSRKSSKKQVVLEPIEEDVKKENLNGEGNEDHKAQSPEDSTNPPQSHNQSQNSQTKVTPKPNDNSSEKQNSNVNFNGKIPDLAPL